MGQISVYKKGKLVSRKHIEVSEEDLYQEAIARQSNDGIHRIKAAFDNWDSLTSAQKREVVRDCLCCLLNLYSGSY